MYLISHRKVLQVSSSSSLSSLIIIRHCYAINFLLLLLSVKILLSQLKSPDLLKIFTSSFMLYCWCCTYSKHLCSLSWQINMNKSFMKRNLFLHSACVQREGKYFFNIQQRKHSKEIFLLVEWIQH